MRRSPASHQRRPLTARECAMLDCLARGMTQKEIAFEFGISINTVGNLAANAYKKLGVHGAAAAVHATGTCTSFAEHASISGPSASASRRAARHRLPHELFLIG